MGHESLGIQYDPSFILGRKEERHQVSEYIDGRIKSTTSGTLYVSGMPGTGKTMTVRSVLESKSKKISSCYINIMEISTGTALYNAIYKKACPDKPSVKANDVTDALQKAFTKKTQKSNVKPFILVLDEIDTFNTKNKQKVLFTLFDWAAMNHSIFGLITIANQMDLPEQLSLRCTSRVGFNRLNFKPYTPEEIRGIVVLRLKDMKVRVDATAIDLCARRVANVSGDMRKALQILRMAAEDSDGHVKIADVDRATNKLSVSAVERLWEVVPVVQLYIVAAYLQEVHQVKHKDVLASKVRDRLETIMLQSKVNEDWIRSAKIILKNVLVFQAAVRCLAESNVLFFGPRKAPQRGTPGSSHPLEGLILTCGVAPDLLLTGIKGNQDCAKACNWSTVW